MNTRRRITLGLATLALTGGLAIAGGAAASAAPTATAAAASTDDGTVTSQSGWSTTISAAYLNSHHKKWVSSTFVPPAGGVVGGFRCWNNGDGGKARLRIYNVETHQWIGDSGYQDCNYRYKYVSADKYRPGQGLRFVLQAQGNAHTTRVAEETAP
ncbi:hypothetical protein [Amycolatopsis pithecellobii]|uniref:Secreted protein n=1 Tax=Amycolatopsis pithecellobii TaxID=664692 RepID=A0A6N7Z7G4_9PSEU|nr:hypothetical protein [Amycolatopsis pithecellobii]MTD57181.1 hypothetical protein [Amycolatopsis pithecellobii]